MSPEERRRQFRVISAGKPTRTIGAVESWKEKIEEFKSDESTRVRAEKIESLLYSSDASEVLSECYTYSILYTALNLEVEVGAVLRQKEIAEGKLEGQVDEDILAFMYESYMWLLHKTVICLAGMYDQAHWTSPYRE